MSNRGAGDISVLQDADPFKEGYRSGNNARRDDIDALRVICAFGIVWYHSGVSGHEVAYSAIVVFAFLSLYLYHDRPGRLGAALRVRAGRLIVPWIVWVFIFSVLLLLRGRDPFAIGFSSVEKLLSGPQIHLWYLPFIFFVLTAVNFIERSGVSRRHLAGGALAVYVVFMLLSQRWRPISLSLSAPWPQYIHALPAVMLGVYLRSAKQFGFCFQISAIALIVISTFEAISLVGVGLPYLIGISVALFVTYFRSTGVLLRFLSGFGLYTLGVYLAHPLFLSFVGKFCGYGGLIYPIGSFLVCLISIMAVYKINRRIAKIVF